MSTETATKPGKPLRHVYRHSGRVNWGHFLPWAMVTLIISALGAFGLHLAYEQGQYHALIAPMLAALVVWVFMNITVSIGHCRSPLIALILGTLAAIVLYVGRFHVGMVKMHGQEFATHIELLPGYIFGRIQNDVLVNFEGVDLATLQAAGLNWYITAAEVLGVFVLAVWYPSRRATRCYCEHCNQWKRRSVVFMPPGHGKKFTRWLGEGLHAPAPELRSLLAVDNRTRYAVSALETCRVVGLPTIGRVDCDDYLTVKEVIYGGGPTENLKLQGVFSKTHLAPTKLTSGEYEIVSQLFVRATGSISAVAEHYSPEAVHGYRNG